MTKDERRRYLILKDKNIYKGLVILALPLMLNNLLKSLHDIVDMFFVSRIPGVSAEAVSSIQLVFPVVFTFLSLGIGLSVAGVALVSQFVGGNDYPQARHYATLLFVIALSFGVVLNVAGYFAAPYIVGAMGAEGFVFENATAYLRIRAFELPIFFTFFAFMATRQASGDTWSPMLVSGGAILLNTVLSPLFISVFGLGVPGAAYATLTSYLVIMPIGVFRLFYAKTGVTIDLRFLIKKRMEDLSVALEEKRKAVFKILKTAAPASVGQAITAIGFGVMNGVIYAYGVETVAAFGIGNRLLSMILHPVMAMGAILSAYIGQNIGAQNPARAKETFLKTMKLSVGIMAVGSLGLIMVREPLAKIFLGDNPEALRLTVDYMYYILLGLPLMAVFQTFIGTFNGTANTHFTFVMAVTRLWGFRIPLVLLAGYLFPERGSRIIWEVMLLSNLLIALVGFLLYTRVDFKPKVDVREKAEIHPATKPHLKTS